MFWPRLEKKPSKENLKYFDLLVVKIRVERLPRNHLEKQQTRRKSSRQDSLHCHCMSSSDFVNKHCCPFKCFIERYRNCLDCLSRSLSYRFSVYGFQWHMNIACRSTQNAPCIIWIWILEVKCKRKWFIDLFLLVFIQTLETMWKGCFQRCEHQVCKVNLKRPTHTKRIWPDSVFILPL